MVNETIFDLGFGDKSDVEIERTVEVFVLSLAEANSTHLGILISL